MEIKEIKVNCGSPYSVFIKKGLLCEAAERIDVAIGAERYFIVSDDNVYPIYGEALRTALEGRGVAVRSLAFSHGEEQKNLRTVEEILKSLAEGSFTRSDCLIALGGGIVGDVCGFAASVYMRGVRFVQIPTTLLAAVDSSVGGKTGVNLMGYKNQIGAFWQPSLVLCDPDTFRTLPEEEYRNGMAEVIKYAAICEPELADILHGDVCEIIARCVAIKSDIVSRDERDTGERMLLNYGHTFGHAVECVTNGAVPHGMAVAIGMMSAARMAENAGIAERGTADVTARILAEHGLPLSAEGYDPKLLYRAMLNDKKRADGRITLVLPSSFGKCILKRITAAELKEFYQL